VIPSGAPGPRGKESKEKLSPHPGALAGELAPDAIPQNPPETPHRARKPLDLARIPPQR